MNINFNLPGMYEHFNLLSRIILLWKDHPEIFYPNINISSCYGNFQFNIFEGGRIFDSYRQTTKEEMEQIVDFYNQNNIAARMIFTNPKITAEHFHNRFMEASLRACLTGTEKYKIKNEIVINNIELENFLRQEVGDSFNFISSTTKCIRNKEDIKQEILNPNYTFICIDHIYNRNLSFLDSFTQEEKDKIEILVNAICPVACQNRKLHYDLNGLFALNYGKAYNIPQCLLHESSLFPKDENPEYSTISMNKLLTNYVPKGFYNFKLEGRSFPDFELACSIIQYLVLPDYQMFALNCLEVANNEF